MKVYNRTELAEPVNYTLSIGDTHINMNELIGTEIKLTFTGQINCISCGKRTKTSFSQGFCYNCLQTAPEASESVLRPELSKSQFGIARDLEWAEKHDLINHYVYLAVSSEVKVGVTRMHQIPTRWIDQGASYAIKLAQTPNRHIAGVIEVLLPAELQKYIDAGNEVTNIQYPVQQYPDKIKSVGFDKLPEISGTLLGIKGQYLLFDQDRVLNIRKHNGYFLRVEM